MAGTGDGGDRRRTERVTLASSVYDELRREIATAHLLPGTRLQTRQLAGRFGVGLSPVREALNRLSSEGLVARRERRGFGVAPVSEADLEALTRTRCWLNEIGLRRSIADGDSRWEEAVVVAYHRLSRTPRQLAGMGYDRNPAWELAHARFHEALISACASSWLMNFCAQMFEAAERYRHIARLEGVTRPNDNEHRDLFNAAIERDADRAVALLNEHFQKTARMVGEVLQAMPPEPMPRRSRRRAPATAR